MTFFSRCDASQAFETSLRGASARRRRTGSLRLALGGFVEDIGILVRYAVGLDYYGRDRLGRPR